MGEALHTVTSLEIHLRDTGSSIVTAALLQDAMKILVWACPTLTSLTIEGSSHLATLCTLGQACPLLSELTVVAEDEDMLELQALVFQLPSLLPTVHSLRFSSLINNLPDMSKNTGITKLCMDFFSFDSEVEVGYDVQWLFLPPRLQQLFIFSAHAGPVPPKAGSGDDCSRDVLCDLHSLDIGLPGVQLRVIADILRAAPALKHLSNGRYTHKVPVIDCFVEPTSAANLSLLLERSSGVAGLRDAMYRFDFDDVWVDVPELLPLLAGLPNMVGVRECEFRDFSLECLGPLLAIFPDVQTLTLWGSESIDDVGLQQVAVCKRLERLEIKSYEEVTPMGLHALCPRLPHLQSVSACMCAHMRAPGLARCVELLKDQGVFVKIVDETSVER